MKPLCPLRSVRGFSLLGVLVALVLTALSAEAFMIFFTHQVKALKGSNLESERQSIQRQVSASIGCQVTLTQTTLCTNPTWTDIALLHRDGTKLAEAETGTPFGRSWSVRGQCAAIAGEPVIKIQMRYLGPAKAIPVVTRFTAATEWQDVNETQLCGRPASIEMCKSLGGIWSTTPSPGKCFFGGVVFEPDISKGPPAIEPDDVQMCDISTGGVGTNKDIKSCRVPAPTDCSTKKKGQCCFDSNQSNQWNFVSRNAGNLTLKPCSGGIYYTPDAATN